MPILHGIEGKGKAFMAFEKAKFVGTLDVFRALDVSARILGDRYGIDCRLAEFVPEKKEEQQAEDKSEVPA